MADEMIPDEERYQICRNAILTFGVEAQMSMVFEELSELITAVARISRGRSSPNEVASEIADAMIMIEQLQMMTNCGPEVANQIEFKLRRLEKRIADVQIQEKETSKVQ